MKKHKDILYILCVISSIYILLIFLIVKIPLKPSAQSSCIITKVNKIENYTSLNAICNLKSVKVVLSKRENVNEGDLVEINGNFEEIKNQTIPGNFNYKNYLLSKNIKYETYTENYKVIKRNTILFYPKIALRNYINNNIEQSKRYVLTFVMADKTYLDQEVKDSFSFLGISHLFALSGMHIGLIVLCIKFGLNRMPINSLVKEVVIYTILSTFMIITSFASSVVRAGLMYIFLTISKTKNTGLSNIDIVSIVFIILIFIKPFSLYDLGFSLSFFVVYLILLFQIKFADHKPIIQLLYIGLLSLVFTLPITYRITYQLNLLSLLFNLTFFYIILFFIMPSSYLLLLFPVLDNLISYIFHYFENVLKWSMSLDFFAFDVYFPNILFIFMYYIYLFIAIYYIEAKKYIRLICLSIVVIFLLQYSSVLNFHDQISFIDVAGDSVLIKNANNSCNILIDTGNVDDFDSVLNYLLYNGVHKIDHLFITHHHTDHFGEFFDIYNRIDVRNVWDNNSISTFTDGQKCGDILLYPLSYSNQERNENNNSIVLLVIMNGDKYLFTGDIEEKMEIQLIEQYNFEVDYLKVAHHGSITSSSENFLQSFKPKEAIIIAKEGNKYNHPHNDVIERIKGFDIRIHRTDLEGTIEFIYYGKKVYKKTYP